MVTEGNRRWQRTRSFYQQNIQIIAAQVTESNLLTKLRTEHKTVPDSIHETLHDRV